MIAAFPAVLHGLICVIPSSVVLTRARFAIISNTSKKWQKGCYCLSNHSHRNSDWERKSKIVSENQANITRTELKQKTGIEESKTFSWIRIIIWNVMEK